MSVTGRTGPVTGAVAKDRSAPEADMVAAWSVDRLGRSLKDLLSFLEELKGADVDLYLQALDTSTPSGRSLFQMLSVFPEFVQAMIRERVVAGLQRARASGKRLGRPPASRSVESRIRRLRKACRGIHAIAKEVGCGVSVVQRVVKAMG